MCGRVCAHQYCILVYSRKLAEREGNYQERRIARGTSQTGGNTGFAEVCSSFEEEVEVHSCHHIQRKINGLIDLMFMMLGNERWLCSSSLVYFKNRRQTKDAKYKNKMCMCMILCPIAVVVVIMRKKS